MNRILSYNKRAEDIASFALARFGIDGITLTIAENEGYLDKFSNEYVSLEALTVGTAMKDAYNMFFRRRNPSPVVVCHEMIHLRQMVEGRLGMDARTGKAFWDGKVYDNKTDYFERPWEIEAFAEQDELLKLYRKK